MAKALTREQATKILLMLDSQNKRKCEKDFFAFVQEAWKILEPRTPLLPTWYLQYICEILQAEVERIAEGRPKTKDLIINAPPRSIKSTPTSILLCPWAWIRYPHLRFINSSFDSNLSTTHTRLGRQVIESPWYQRRWGDRFRLTTDQDTKGHYENDRRGVRYATSVRGSITGHGGDIIVGDDLNDPLKTKYSKNREDAWTHWSNTLWTRLNDPNVGVRIIVQQRVHKEDVTGRALKSDPENYFHVNIPAEDLKEKGPGSVSPRELKAFYRGGFMFPERFSRAVLDKAKNGMLASDYDAQYNGDTTTAGGVVLMEEWWQFYDALPFHTDRWITSWDCAFKDKDTSSWVVGQVWCKRGPNSYLVDQVRGHWALPATIGQVQLLAEKYPQARGHYIEDKANGPAVIQVLGKKIPGLVPVSCNDGDKVSRAVATTEYMKAGNIHLPRPEAKPWVKGFISECNAFPSKPDDQVDAYSQAIDELYKGLPSLDIPPVFA